MDEAPLHDAPVQVGCAFVALPFQVDSINPKSHVLDYPCLKDNLWTTYKDDGCQPQFVSKMKHGTGGGQHPWPEGKVHLCRSFPSKVGGIVSLGICCAYLSKGVLPRGRSNGTMEQPPAKSSPSGLP